MAQCQTHQRRTIRSLDMCPDCIIDAYHNGVKSRNGDMFCYSSYWGVYSRMLSGGNYLEGIGFVEVDLTAINPRSDLNWPRVARINIRAHATPRSPKDEISYALPSHVFEMMSARLPDPALLAVLIHRDLLPLIDFEKYRKVSNGGAALADILK